MHVDRRAGAVWGAAGIVWAVSLRLVRPVTGDLLDPPVSAVVGAAPGWLATAAIEAFGGAAQTLLAVGSAAAFVVLLAVAGALLGTTRTPLPAVAGGFALAALALYWLVPLPVRPVGLVAAAGTGLPPTIFVRAGRTTPWQGTDYARRRSLRRVVRGGAAVGALGALSQVSAWAGARVGPPRADDPLPERFKRETGRTVGGANSGTDEAAETTGDFGFDFAGMPPRVEDADDHYVVDINRQDPVVRADSWTLSVTGGETEYDLTLDDLIDHPDAVSVPATLVCISNTVGGDLISTTTWQAVPLDSLLDRAGVPDDAVDVVTRAVDGYSEAIPVEAAREMTAFVAFGAGGSTLESAHGFPARLLLPGRYGMKSTKWLTEIELATEDHAAYWERRGWVERAAVNTLAYVRGAAQRDGEVAVGGVAYAGDRGVDRVEVSRDGGETWHEADLEAPPSPHAWRRWRLVFPAPDADEVTIVARATDGTGERQTAESTGPHPGGSTGFHEKTISL